MENEYPWLSERTMTKRFLWECQAKENIVYCGALEHLYLHILIAEITSANGPHRSTNFPNGTYGMISGLFDVYGGYETKVS